MAKKPVISSVPQNNTNTLTINNNFENVRDKFDNTLSRDGSTPNSMAADLDMDSNDILNARTVYADTLSVNGQVIASQALYSATVEKFSDLSTIQSGDVAVGGFILVLDSLQVFERATDATTDAHLDYSSSGGLKWYEAGPNFSTRARMVAAKARMDAAGDTVPDGTIWTAAGHAYRASSGATAISDMPGFLPSGNVTPHHFGAVADGSNNDDTAVAAAETYVASLDDGGSQIPASELVPMFFPAGHHTSAAGRVLETDGLGFTFHGVGPTSQLDKIDIKINDYKSQVSDLFLHGASPIGIATAVNGGREGRAYKALNLFIRDKTTAAIELDGSVWGEWSGIYAEKNAKGLWVKDTIGDRFVNSEVILSESHNVHFTGGGELRLIGFRAREAGFGSSGTGAANFRIEGTAASTAVESYFSEVSLSGAQVGQRRYAISSIANNGSGKLRVTTTSAHEMYPGYIDAALDGTANYDGTDLTVLDVISSTVLDLDVTYVADEATGNLEAPGWDLHVSAETAPQEANDFFFSGGNINNTKINGGYNINFFGTRLKQGVYLGDDVETNRLFMVRNGRGRQDNTHQDVPVYGPGSHKGWGEVGMFAGASTTFTVDGTEHVAMRMPSTAAGVGSDSLPVRLNSLAIYSNKAEIKAEGTTLTIDGNGINYDDDLTIDGTFKVGNTVETTKSGLWFIRHRTADSDVKIGATHSVDGLFYPINIDASTKTLLLGEGDGKIRLEDLPTYADEAAASSLATNSVYMTSTGELRIKL